MIIRRLNNDDIESFWMLQNAIDQETKFMLYEPGERVRNDERIKSFIEEMKKGNFLLLVAEEVDELVGYCMVDRGRQKKINHSAYIVIGIKKKYTNRGIGSSFFKEIDLWAKEEKITRLELSVITQNKIALHLYEKFGYEIEGVKRNSLKTENGYMDEYYLAKIME